MFVGAEEDTSLSFQQDPSFSVFDKRLNIQENLVEDKERPFLKKGLIRSLSVGGSWTPDRGDDGAGITEFKFGLTVACPAPKFKPFTNSFFLFSPNFTYTNVRWSGSEAAPIDFPENLYGAGLSVTWMKPLNERWSIMANASPGYAGDGKANRDNVRCTAMFGATWTPNKKWKVLMGVAYLNRSDIPVLPFGGFTYMPNDDWKFECMAPQPRIARRLTYHSTLKLERWVYLGGGTWAIDIDGQNDLAMYREYSVLLGYESNNKFRSFQWNAEVAFLFGREMQFEYDTQPNRKLGNALALRLRCTL